MYVEVRRLALLCIREKKQKSNYFYQSGSNKVSIGKCSDSIHFELVSAHCVIQLFLSYAFFSFVKQKIFMSQ